MARYIAQRIFVQFTVIYIFVIFRYWYDVNLNRCLYVCPYTLTNKNYQAIMIADSLKQ